MKLICLSYCNPLSMQVIGSIHERHPVAGIVRVEWQPPLRSATRLSRWRKSPVAMLQQGLDRRVENWQHTRRMQRVSEIFTGRQKMLPDVPIYTVGSRELHKPASLEVFHSLEADVLLVSHAPLLKPSLFQLPRVASLNIHWGIAPNYCGEHTLFWPLYFRDFAHVGLTIHRIDAGIDTGPILAQGFPPLFPADTEADLLARCAGVASELTCEILDAVKSGDPLQGKTVAEPSRLFLRRDRHAIQSLSYWARRKLLREKLPTLHPRQLCFFNPVDAELVASI